MYKTPAAPNSSKRKAVDPDDLPMPNGIVSRPVKQPRLTIDAFFSPKISISVGGGIGAMGGGKMMRDKTVDVVLSDEQRQVLKMVVDEGKSVFFTGSAGTGKSLLLKAIIAALRRKHAKKPGAVAVTASTGMAASNIGGQTIHAWGAIAPTVEDLNKLERDIRSAKPALNRWKTTQILVVDEVSMVDGHLFDRIAKLAVRLRNNLKVFGGLQLVVTGDFFQLPPVTKGKEVPFFAFECDAWKKSIAHTIILTQVFRQKDSKFIDLLNELRHGTLTPAATEAFRALARPLLPSKSALPPTQLFPMRHEVENANTTRLKALTTPVHVYQARDSGTAPPDKRKSVLASMTVPEEVVLKTGAQVMLVRNVDERRSLVNGSVGRVKGFFHAVGGKSEGVVRDLVFGEDGRPILESKPIPVKSEGVNSKENKKPRNSSSIDADELFPYVEFSTPQGKVSVLVMRDEFKVEDNEGKVLARRVQVPLILAWAISIHKSQGQTLQRVKIDLGRVFEKGQSYVALSRAASMEGLQVLGFDPKKVVAHPKVIEWSKTLETCNT